MFHIILSIPVLYYLSDRYVNLSFHIGIKLLSTSIVVVLSFSIRVFIQFISLNIHIVNKNAINTDVKYKGLFRTNHHVEYIS